MRTARQAPRRIALLLALGLTALGASSTAGAATEAELQLFDVVNETRRAHGLVPLRLDRRLELAARSHSGHMLRFNYFDHRAFSWRLKRYRARGPVFGENLAWMSGARLRAREVVRMWLGSPGHRATLLRPGFRRIGLAAASGSFLGVSAATVVTAEFAGV